MFVPGAPQGDNRTKKQRGRVLCQFCGEKMDEWEGEGDTHKTCKNCFFQEFGKDFFPDGEPSEQEKDELWDSLSKKDR